VLVAKSISNEEQHQEALLNCARTFPIGKILIIH